MSQSTLGQLEAGAPMTSGPRLPSASGADAAKPISERERPDVRPTSRAIDHRPLYRVVEMTRGADGRMHKQGNIWHPTPDVPRRFARAIANCGGDGGVLRVLVGDSRGRVLEEVPLIAPSDTEASAVNWSTWRQAPLPPLPQAGQRRGLPARTSRSFEDAMGIDDLDAALDPHASNSRIPADSARHTDETQTSSSGRHAESCDIDVA